MTVYTKSQNTREHITTNYVLKPESVVLYKSSTRIQMINEINALSGGYLYKETLNQRIPFNDLATFYLDDSRQRHRPTTHKVKTYTISTHILPYFKDMAITSITPRTVRDWQNHLLSEKGDLSETYKRALHTQLSAILNYAVKFFGLSQNPCRLAGSIGQTKAGRMHFYTKTEFDDFITHVKRKPMYVVIFKLLFYTGIRSGELMALTLDDFDFEKRMLSITKSYARINRKDLITKPKTEQSIREVTLPKFICEMIKDYAETLIDYKSDERLFNVTKFNLHHTLKGIIKRGNLKPIRVHDLRHSHASLLIEMGFSTVLISERLGHESIKTTLETYSHLYPNKQRAVAKKLDEIFDKAI